MCYKHTSKARRNKPPVPLRVSPTKRAPCLAHWNSMQFKVTDKNGIHIRNKPANDDQSRVIGQFAFGEVFETIEVFSNKAGQVWGRLTKAYETNQEYVLIQAKDNIRAEPTPIQPTPAPYSLIIWAIEIDNWARSNGYNGKKPTGL
jgi:hypothetical protein